jgi:UDP-N-acetylglucosamine:LPS N-acetylglucosamine transferase
LGDAETRGGAVIEALRALIADPETLRSMSRAARSIARPNAARDIVDECATMLEAEGAKR